MSTRRIILSLLLLANLVGAQAQENAAPPAPAAPTQAEMLDWLATNHLPWEAAFKRDVAEVRDAEIARIAQQYLAAIESGMAKASSAYDLQGALALRDEQKRFTETRLLPEQDEAATTPAVKQVRAAFRAQFAKAENEAAARARALHAKYDQALAQAQAQLTQRQRLDDALLVQKKREEVAAVWIKPAAATAANAAAASSAPRAAEDALSKLTSTGWTWETRTGKNTITFAQDGTCGFRGGSGTFELKGSSVTVMLAAKPHVLNFDFEKGEYTGYAAHLNQTITGRRIAPAAAAEPPVATPAASPAPKLGAVPASPAPKGAYDAQLTKLTRTVWTWETPKARSTIKFSKDGTCAHPNFNGTFEIQADNTVVVKMTSRNQVLLFDFNKGEYTGYDSILKQKITGKRTYQR